MFCLFVFSDFCGVFFSELLFLRYTYYIWGTYDSFLSPSNGGLSSWKWKTPLLPSIFSGCFLVGKRIEKLVGSINNQLGVDIRYTTYYNSYVYIYITYYTSYINCLGCYHSSAVLSTPKAQKFIHKPPGRMLP